MPSFRNEQDQFFYELDQKKKQDPEQYSVLDKVLKTDDGKQAIFDLCKQYECITLNAPKFKDGSAYLQEVDIKNAIASTKQFCEKYEITDYESLLNVIYQMHPLTAEWGDKRAGGSTIDWNNVSQHRLGGVVGTYYDFSKIPEDAWPSIKADVISDLSNKDNK